MHIIIPRVKTKKCKKKSIVKKPAEELKYLKVFRKYLIKQKKAGKRKQRNKK